MGLLTSFLNAAANSRTEASLPWPRIRFQSKIAEKESLAGKRAGGHAVSSLRLPSWHPPFPPLLLRGRPSPARSAAPTSVRPSCRRPASMAGSSRSVQRSSISMTVMAIASHSSKMRSCQPMSLFLPSFVIGAMDWSMTGTPPNGADCTSHPPSHTGRQCNPIQHCEIRHHPKSSTTSQPACSSLMSVAV
jgi:hypothetical protein